MLLTAANCQDRCIGDLVRYQGMNYVVTANYPRHGYLLMRQKRVTSERTLFSFRVWYDALDRAA